MLADVSGQNMRRLLAANPRSERLVQVGAAVAETVADGVQYATGVGEVVEADSRAAADGQLFVAAADDAEVEVWRKAVA